MATLTEQLHKRLLFDRGVRLAGHEKYAEALTLFEAVLARDPEDALALSNAGFCQFKLGEPEVAIEAYRHAKEMDTADFQIPYDLGCAYYAHGRKQDAFDAFREALDRMPSHREAYSAMEKVRLELNLPLAGPAPGAPKRVNVTPGRIVIEKAPPRRRGDKAAEPAPARPPAPLPPRSPEELIEMGHQLFGEGQVDQALRAWEEACRQQPNNPVAQNNRAAALLELKRYQEAIEASSEALRMQPTYAVAHMTRGEVYAALGNREAVLREYTALTQLDEDLARLLVELIELPEKPTP
jgi:superkiller protein 3